MLENPVPLERRCPRRWSPAAAHGLLSLAVLAAGVTWKATAAPAPEPKKEEPKAETPAQPPAVPDPFLPNLDDALKNLPPNLTPEQAEQLRARLREAHDAMRKALELQRRNGPAGLIAPFNPALPGASQPQEGRLGVVVEKPSETLVEQLDLPRDQGLIVRDVMADSAAAKAGLKAHDILLEVDGKVVPSDPGEFRKTLESVKADTPVDVVVLRKGKKETVKGLSLPEAKAGAGAVPGFPAVAPPVFAPDFPNIPAPVFPPIGVNPIPPGTNGVITSTFRSNDHFTTRHQEGSLIITLTGKVEGGKATVTEISVQDGTESNQYESLDKTPEKYRDKVKNLMEMTEKGSVKVEVKTP